MASPAAAISRQDVATLVRQVQGNQLLNRQLSSICQVNGLKSTGVKAELQRRIVDLIQETVRSNDASRFQQVRQSILNAALQRGSPTSKPVVGRSTTTTGSGFSGPMASYTLGTNSNQRRDYLTTSGSNVSPTNSTYSPASQLAFQPSPFYRIESRISSVNRCEAMAQHRYTVTIRIRLGDHEGLQKCVNDSSYRVLIFCAADILGVQNVAFPHQSELKVNGGEIKANLRGLKNKPGSTRPVDITDALRLRPHYVNNVEFTYALTTKAFYLVANLCKVTSVPELVSIISKRRRIPKESVISDLNRKAQDPDVVATSQVLSLKCPLSYMRLAVPCRSMGCTHIQCFDATSYLQLQEQGPLWLCPICNKPAPFEQLAVDEYVKDILANTPHNLETVTIEPNGIWSKKTTNEEQPQMTNGSSLDDDDDLEISEVTVLGRRFDTPRTQTPLIGTPVSGTRDSSSSAPRAHSGNSTKRSAPTVIDLTLESDGDEPLERPPKRQHTGTGTNGFHASINTGFLSESPLGHRPY